MRLTRIDRFRSRGSVCLMTDRMAIGEIIWGLANGVGLGTPNNARADVKVRGWAYNGGAIGGNP